MPSLSNSQRLRIVQEASTRGIDVSARMKRPTGALPPQLTQSQQESGYASDEDAMPHLPPTPSFAALDPVSGTGQGSVIGHWRAGRGQ